MTIAVKKSALTEKGNEHFEVPASIWRIKWLAAMYCSTRYGGYNAGVTTHTLETHIYRLRQKDRAESRQMRRLLVTESGGYRSGAIADDVSLFPRRNREGKAALSQ